MGMLVGPACWQQRRQHGLAHVFHALPAVAPPAAAPPQQPAGVPAAAATDAQLSSQQLLQALQGAMAAAAGGGGQPAQQGWAQPEPAAPQPAAMPAPAPAAAPGIQLTGQQLLQALQGAMAAAAGAGLPGIAPQAAPAAAQPPPPQQQQAAAPSTSRHGGDRHATTPKPTVPAPAWTKQAVSWVLPASQPDSAVLPSAEAAAQGGAVQQACSKVVGQGVSLGATHGGGAGSLHLPLSPAQPEGSLKLTAAAVDAAIARLPPGGGTVLALQAAWLRAGEVLAGAEGQRPEVAAVMRLWQARLAKKAAGVLATDEDDDLFFAGGKHRSAFLSALVSLLSPARGWRGGAGRGRTWRAGAAGGLGGCADRRTRPTAALPASPTLSAAPAGVGGRGPRLSGCAGVLRVHARRGGAVGGRAARLVCRPRLLLLPGAAQVGGGVEEVRVECLLLLGWGKRGQRWDGLGLRWAGLGGGSARAGLRGAGCRAAGKVLRPRASPCMHAPPHTPAG